MKKKIGIMILLVMLLCPLKVRASVATTNLEETLTEEKIEHDLKNYKETEEQIPIYLFRGSGCTYCNSFLTFLNSIVDEYGQYFKLVSYEVWNNKDNSNLMTKVANFLNQTATGVPFIVIGEQAFVGYGASSDENIKNAITTLYNSKDRYDVFEKIEEQEKEEAKKNKGTSQTAIIIWNICITGTATLIIIYYDNKKYQKLNESIVELNKKLKNKK